MPACGRARGCRGATVMPFGHNDSPICARCSRERRAGHGHALVATDGVFSMDGDLAPLPALAGLRANTTPG